MISDERAVSEVLGYVLVFALVTATIGIVFTIGIGGLQSAQQSEQVNNVERAFDVFSHNVEDIHRRDAPSRATEVRLIGGTLGFDDRSNFTVETDQYNTSIHPEPLVYRSDGGTEIVYEAGAIIRTDGDSSVMLKKPNMHFSDRQSHLAIIQSLRSIGSAEEVRGDRVVLVVGVNRGTELMLRDENPNDVTIMVNSTRHDAWARYFEDEFDGDVEVDDNTVTFTFSTEEIRVTRPRINLEMTS